MRVGNAVVLLAFLGVLGGTGIECTSSQNLHNLLRHPHYADGHQHSSHNHLQPSTTYPLKKYNDAKSSFAPSFPKGARDDPPSGPWNRVAPVYKMNGYTVKSTSATKSSPLTALEPEQLPQELAEVRAANEHFVSMRSGARCHHPRPQVVCVRDVYPEKEFLPRCTLLHRCTASAGCCEDDSTQCGPRSMQEVALHFYVLGDHRSSDVEKLLFVNHTECECQSKPTPETPPTDDSRPEEEETHKNAVDHYPQGDQKSPKCRPCPSPFSVRELEEGGRCSCDCFDRHKPCTRIKRGREALQDAQRRCVVSGHCNVPDCDFGPFDPDNGRCPRDKTGFKAGEHGRRPHPNSRNPNHRWTYFERD